MPDDDDGGGDDNTCIMLIIRRPCTNSCTDSEVKIIAVDFGFVLVIKKLVFTRDLEKGDLIKL